MHEIINLDITEAAITELSLRFAVVPDATTPDGYKEIVSDIQVLRSTWGKVEKRRKELKANALAYGRDLDAEAKRVTGLLKAIATPLIEARKVVDEAQAKVDREAAELEAKRIETIAGHIVDIEGNLRGVLDMTAADIRLRLDALTELVISEDIYMEFVAPATSAREDTINALIKAFRAREEIESRQAEITKKEAEQKAERVELDFKQAVIDAQDAERVQREADELRAKQDKEARERAESAREALMPDYNKVLAYTDKVLETLAGTPDVSNKEVHQEIEVFCHLVESAAEKLTTWMRDEAA